MSGGSTQFLNHLFFILIPIAVIAAIILAVTFDVWYNIIIHGKLAGPCVWPGDYVDHAGGSMDDLVYNEDIGCYQESGF